MLASLPATGPLTGATPLAALPAFVFDCETTGLDVARDRIVSLGGVRMRGPHIQHDSAIDRLVDPQRPIPARATAIHGITDAMVAQADPFGAHWAVLADSMRDAVLVGHNIAFDIAHLRRAARRAEIEWHPPPSLDTLLLAAALEPRAGSVELEAVAARLGVPVHGRHTALGDSLVTAAVFARQIVRLAERKVTTLGDAVAFGQRARAFVRRQRAAGWFDEPTD
ncbi:MAG: 3'-5' exonuclease [Rhodospirillaceae bacterium]|nr:3'-5' exonuclease [Rhodospirillaceae bacterium]